MTQSIADPRLANSTPSLDFGSREPCNGREQRHRLRLGHGLRRNKRAERSYRDDCQFERAAEKRDTAHSRDASVLLRMTGQEISYGK